MQTRIIIEVTVDYLDKNKLPAIITACKRTTAQLNAKVQLLADGQPPNVCLFSDDFYEGKVELEYLYEQMQEETKTTIKPVSDQSQISADFLNALKGD